MFLSNQKIITPLDGAPTSGIVTFIMRTNTPKYAPQGVTIRTQITPQIFTGQADFAVLEKMADDAEIISITISKPSVAQEK